MFTGLVKGLGRVASITPLAGEVRLAIEAGFEWDGPLEIGESICVSGVCLTVTETAGPRFTAHVSAETISRTVMRSYNPGDPVNLERALRLADRLGGHLVTGHVDGLGVIKDRRDQDMSVIFTVGLQPDLARFVIEKGSIAIDGISLTVNRVRSGAFTVNVIPHTLGATTLGGLKAGELVNLEFDLIGKYIARMSETGHSGNLTKDKLLESGW